MTGTNIYAAGLEKKLPLSNSFEMSHCWNFQSQNGKLNHIVKTEPYSVILVPKKKVTK